MQIKVLQTNQLIVPRYETRGSILTLKITDKFKYLILPVKMSFMEINIPELTFDILSREILQYTSDIVSRYQESENGVYSYKSPRLPLWTGDIFYAPTTGKKIVEGLTGLPTAAIGFSGITLGKNMYDVAGQMLYYFSLNGGPDGATLLNGNTFNSGITAYFPTDKFLNKYESAGWYTNLDLQRGITSRGGTANWYTRLYSFNDFIKKPYPDYTLDASIWANPRNKLLNALGELDEIQSQDIFQDMLNLAAGWKYSLQASQNMVGSRSYSRTDEVARVNNQEILELLRKVLYEIKDHYPLARPRNAVSSSVTTTWMSVYAGQKQYLGMSGGIRVSPFLIGNTYDYDYTTGITYNTYSPNGWTADQGEYLFDGWKRRDLVNTMHLLTGVTLGRMPEGISGGQSLSTILGWNTVLDGIKNLLFKEIYDHVKFYWERRAWFQAVTSNKGRDDEFEGDIDNLGFIQTNQWHEPLCGAIMAIMYIYPLLTSDQHKQAIRAAYNMCTELLAGVLERALWTNPPEDGAGVWIESWGYANQSMDSILWILDTMKNMGDRRLWDLKTKRGTGITYSVWANNAWKWAQSRIMPNGLIINCGSTDSDSYTDNSNSYNITGLPLTHAAVLVSEYPPKGNNLSAQAQMFNVFRKTWGWWGLGTSSLYFYEQKLYAESVNNTPTVRAFKRGYFYPDDQTFIWNSDFIVPSEQFSQPGYGFNYETNTNITLTSKPFVFGLWGKGAGKFDGKAHRDEGHVSAYMGEAIILLESGEIRADHSTARALFEKEDTGHNRMQLGGLRRYSWPRPAKITQLFLGDTGGFIFMDTTTSYNTQSLTAAVGPYSTNGMPFGPATEDQSLKYYYQYQIGKVTRGVSWSYEPYNNVSSYIRFTDYVGISGICAGASGPTDRIYYRFHAGYTGATSGFDNRFVIGSVPGTNNKKWTVGWTASIGLNTLPGGYTCDYVGITFTFTGDQPLGITKILASNRGMQWSANVADVAKQTKNYAIDVRLGLSGASVHNENVLNLITEINSTIFYNKAPIIIPTETPQIRNYAAYNLGSTGSISKSVGCSSGFAAPTYVFPTWSIQLSKYAGISFGKILIRDFTKLGIKAGFTSPNQNFTCSP